LVKPHIAIISPALANANNGNWQTASRWQRFLQQRYRVTIARQWDGTPVDALIALHARRSAESIAAFTKIHPSTPAIVVLTGTDLYRDLKTDADAQRSLQLATRLVVLQSSGLSALDPTFLTKTSVIYQSSRSLKPAARSPAARYFDVIMIGHLRDEKDPAAFMRAAALMTDPDVRMTHVGGATDPALGAQAELTQNANPRYHWLGNLPHAATRQLLKNSDLMVIASKMEGGANVVIEAVTSGVPVLASDISGNRGMLGDNYAGYFPLGDSKALARLIEHARSDAPFLAQLRAQCAARAPLFSPEREKAAVLELVDNALKSI
jgi:putative glycosyltransferase (TIGR04348 family)